MSHTTDDIRNIALVGNAGTGKTMLAEAILHAGGMVASAGSIERGTTVSDFDPREQRMQRSVKPSVCHLDHGGVHVNLIDTPGSRDFEGRSLSVLTAVETVLVVIDAQAGIDSTAQQYMDFAAERGLCRMIVVNKIDAGDVDLASVTDGIQTTFGPQCLPLNLPADGGQRVVDCFFEPADVTPDFDGVASAHTKIVDQVVEVDDELMELYLEQGESITPEQLHDPFEQALREGHLIPICFVSGRSGAGVRELLHIIERLMPSPTEGNPPLFMKGEGADAQPVTVTSDPNGHVIAHVFKIDIDPFRGRLGVFRIHQGVIHTGDRLLVGDGGNAIKVAHLLKLNGKTQVEVDRGLPGDICAVPRADALFFDAVLHDSPDEEDFHIKSVDLPLPVYGLAIRTQSDSDAQRVADALHTLEAEDPSMQVDHVRALNETVLRGTSDMHLRDVIEEIETVYNVKIETAEPGVAYRETITKSAEGHHRHKKQTGGAGQFGEVYLKVEPLARGGGFEFVNEVVGGVIPSQYIPAVEKGVRQVMAAGAISGYPMQDVRVTVYDGKHHAVDSKEVAFVAAGRKAFLDAVSKAGPVVMEPVVNVKVRVPGDCTGNVTGDLAAMGGSVNGTNLLEGGIVEVSGQAPLRELQSYHSRLKSISAGEGSFSMEFSHYREVDESLQKELVAAHRPSEEE